MKNPVAKLVPVHNLAVFAREHVQTVAATGSDANPLRRGKYPLVMVGTVDVNATRFARFGVAGDYIFAVVCKAAIDDDHALAAPRLRRIAGLVVAVWRAIVVRVPHPATGNAPAW